MAALLLAVALAGQGCGAGRSCSDVGGYSGVRVTIARALFSASGAVTVEVCDVGACGRTTQRLGVVPEGPVARDVGVTFDDLRRRFGPGSVTVSVELSGSRGEILATARRDIRLARTYPHGRSCDGDGHVVGSFTLDGSDRT